MDNNKKNNLILAVSLAAIFGLIGGFVSNLIFSAYFHDIYESVFLREIDLEEYGRSNLIIREAKKVVVEQDDRIADLTASAQPSLVGIFKKITKGDKSFSLENYYSAGKEAGQGLFITSDGWIITNLKIENPADFVVITSNKNVYAINKVIADKSSSFYYLQISGRDFPVKAFSDQRDLKNGQSVAGVNWGGQVFLTSIIENKSGGLIKSSDTYFNELVLEKNPANGLAVFGLGGEVVALVEKDGKVRPISHFASAIRSVLKNKMVKRASLGVNYVDMAEFISLEVKDLNQNKGAMIYNEGGQAVVAGSAAEKAGLRAGDLIISANNIELSKNYSLTDAIQGFAPEDSITLSYIRNGEKKDAQIKLGELK